jgi:hypothetical protein
MNLQQMMLVDSSRPAQLLQSAANPALDKTEAARFLDVICGQGDCLHLRPQQRVPPPAGKVFVLREGMLALQKVNCRYWISWCREMSYRRRPFSPRLQSRCE